MSPAAAPAPTTEQLLRYWRACLADGDLPNPPLDREESLDLTPEELDGGRLDRAKTEYVFKVAEREIRRKRPPKDRHKPIRLVQTRVLVAPLLMEKRRRHGWVSEARPQTLSPLWMSAALERDGRLFPDPDHHPWIPRQFLQPVAGHEWTLGPIRAFDDYLTAEGPAPDLEWSESLAWARALFAAVGGAPPEEYEHEDVTVIGPKLLIVQIEKGFRRPLLELVDHLVRTRPGLPLIDAIAAAPEPREAPPPEDLEQAGHRLHQGQMTRRFPLSPSQRQSLHACLELDDGELATVNGPPGTGKTTLVQSLAASLWVERALAGGEAPVIHVTSTNNQAVTNVLDSFEAVASAAAEPLEERWLPGVTSYGLYLPSQRAGARANKRGYQVAFPGSPWGGFPDHLVHREDFQEARAFYLERAQEALGVPAGSSVTVVLERLQEEMQVAVKELGRWLKLARERSQGSASEGWGRDLDPAARRQALTAEMEDLEGRRQELLDLCAGVPWWEDLLTWLPPVKGRRDRRLTHPLAAARLPVPELPQQGFREALLAPVEDRRQELKVELELLAWLQRALQRDGDGAGALREALATAATPWQAVPAILDVGLRHRLFHLAGRYWEGRWLADGEAAGSVGGRPGGQSRADCERRLRRLAKLTPVFVSTLYKSPRIFSYWDADESQAAPLLAGVDLLIVDEAGQVPPEIGAAVLPLARRAVVIGDEYQIEPIWAVHGSVDGANLESAGLASGPIEKGKEDPLAALRCSSSSLLKTAQRATRWTAPGRKDGLFLSEHRRSVPEVVAYCNELVYEGKLEPRRPPLEDPRLPSLGWAHVDSRARRVRGSWANPGEARAIVLWLRDRRLELEAFYGLPLWEIVGVVTPFVAQRVELEKLLRRLRPKGSLEPMVEAGTVHTFQGAERPLMIFSPVYSAGTAPERYFFDDGPNMLNVAVSRARDSFLVFGDMGLFRPRRSQVPSELLASHLFASPEHELAGVAPAPDRVDQAKKKGALVTSVSELEAHRDLLKDAFREAKEELIVVSPYLSEKAVEADGILYEVRAAAERRVKVVIAYCLDLQPRPEITAPLARALKEAGAEVHALDRVHSKLLAVDRRWYVEGSFNWLGASRDPKSPHARWETSTRIGEPFAGEIIEARWNELRKMMGEGGASGEG